MYGIPGMIDFQSIGLDIKGVSEHWNKVYMVVIQKSQGLKVYNWIKFQNRYQRIKLMAQESMNE